MQAVVGLIEGLVEIKRWEPTIDASIFMINLSKMYRVVDNQVLDCTIFRG